jgi:hypothetical protein
MKLKERFLDHVYCFMGSGMLTNTYSEDIADWNAEKCEIIADSFAIEFSEWLMENCQLTEDGSLWSYDSEDWSMEGLLEIYKEEKGL